MYSRENRKKISCPEKVIAVTNRKLCDGDFLDQIKKITELGVRAVILREKDLLESEYEVLAAQVMEICHGTDTICILHNFPLVAERLGCDCMHLPLPVFHNYIEGIRKNDKINIFSCLCFDDFSMTEIECREPEALEIEQSNLDKINVEKNNAFNECEKRENLYIGTSVHSIEQAKEAMTLGASYMTAGHIFSTQCKPGLTPRGIDFLKNICQTVQVPVFGIGGIHPDNMQQVLDAGAAGVCMMSEMMRL